MVELTTPFKAKRMMNKSHLGEQYGIEVYFQIDDEYIPFTIPKIYKFYYNQTPDMVSDWTGSIEIDKVDFKLEAMFINTERFVRGFITCKHPEGHIVFEKCQFHLANASIIKAHEVVTQKLSFHTKKITLVINKKIKTIEEMVEEVFTEHLDELHEYRKGNTHWFGFFVGKVAKKYKEEFGQDHVAACHAVVKQELDKPYK